MEKFKKVCVFLVILVVFIYLAVVIPMKKHSKIIDNILSQNVLSQTNNEYSNYSQLMKSNVSNDQKEELITMYTESLKKQELQEKMFLKLMFYLSLLSPAITIILSILSLKFVDKAKKYINYAFITSGALSIAMILIYAYGIYISMRA